MQALLQETYANYDSLNAYLFFSLNMEIVYAILQGVNVVLREINGVSKDGVIADSVDTEEFLKPQDFTDNREIRLKKMRTLPQEYFANMEAK